MSFEFKFNYNVTTTPELIQDNGVMTIKMINFSASASASPKIEHDQDK